MPRRVRLPPLELDLLPPAERDVAWERLVLVCTMWCSWQDRRGALLPEWAIAAWLQSRGLDPSTIEAMRDPSTQRDFERLLNGGSAWPVRG